MQRYRILVPIEASSGSATGRRQQTLRCNTSAEGIVERIVFVGRVAAASDAEDDTDLPLRRFLLRLLLQLGRHRGLPPIIFLGING